MEVFSDYYVASSAFQLGNPCFFQLSPPRVSSAGIVGVISRDWSSRRVETRRASLSAPTRPSTRLDSKSTLKLVSTEFKFYRPKQWTRIFQLECGGIIRESRGLIKSPKYPGNYPGSTTCEWNVIVRPGRTINVRFDNLQIASDPPSCSQDYVIVIASTP